MKNRAATIAATRLKIDRDTMMTTARVVAIDPDTATGGINGSEDAIEMNTVIVMTVKWNICDVEGKPTTNLLVLSREITADEKTMLGVLKIVPDEMMDIRTTAKARLGQ